MTDSSNEKSIADNKAVTGNLSVKVNGGQETLTAFQLLDLGVSLVFMFGNASSHTGVVITEFPKGKLEQELEYDKDDPSVSVKYRVNSENSSWEGGKIKVAAKAGGGYEGTLQAVGSAAGSGWTLSEGKFTVGNE